MPNRRTLCVLIQLGLAVAPAALAAQTATGVVGLPSIPAEPERVLRHNKELVATYDSVADSTHLALVTQKGKYFLWIQRPRLTWTVTYAGRTPGTTPPAEIGLLFRTQEPQVPVDSRLVIEFAQGERIEVASSSGYSDPGAVTWSHFMRFLIPTADLVRALGNETMSLSVGGIRVDFKPNQMEVLRDFLSRVGAWPPVPESGGA